MSKTLDYIALIVVFIGAVNWGLIGLFRLDLVRLIFGDMTWISRIIYVLVGICGIYLLTFLGRVDQEGEPFCRKLFYVPRMMGRRWPSRRGETGS